MFYVYILYSTKLRKKYIGYTEDLRNRVEQHNSGKVTFTAKGRPWQLIYYQAFVSKLDAQEEERFLKSGKGRERLKILLKHTLQENNTPP